jgi:hypothetical protein
MMGRKMEIGRRVESDLTFTVIGRTAEDDYSVAVEISRIYGEIRQPMQPPLTFDTDAEEEPAAMSFVTHMATALAGRTVRVTVHQNGQVVATEGYVEALRAAVDAAPENPTVDREQLRAGVTEETAISQMQLLFPMLPEEPPSVDATFKGSTFIGMELELHSTITRLDDQVLGFESSGAFQLDPAAGLQEEGLVRSSVKGTVEVSRTDGLILKAHSTEKQLQNTETPMGVIPVRVTRTRIVERLEQPPKQSEGQSEGQSEDG